MLKKSVVLKRKKLNLPTINYKNILFLILFISGFIIGLLTIKNSNQEFTNILKECLLNYIRQYKLTSFLNTLFSSVIFTFAVPFICFVFGLCAVGSPVILFLPIFSGIVSGLIIGIFYSVYSLQGLGFSALILIPEIAIITATLIKCCGESLNMSFEIILQSSGFNSSKNNKNHLKEYCLTFLVYCLPLLFSSVLFTCSFKLFIGLFNFV